MIKTGRPKKEPPPDAAQRIRELSSEGHSQIGIANFLGVSATTLKRWLQDFPALREQYDLGIEKERFDLTDMLYSKAMKGDTVAAMFLLKSRHGYRDNGTDVQVGNRVSINFTLPAALPLSDMKVIEHGNADNRTLRLSAEGHAAS
ncbi:MAG: hypothetical protein KJ871_04255 [Alphaproteobacteria bacterium]|nr:hypothetical protein [Alphaproteobacteria bacterium]MBU2082606.1 hypothetical protein [Alphaproteobacteria bacterium]MBU2142754.1 hypothetical protein [Alphaproteobacteria bacterium]MBU2195176.1 hypothetical protein [Alphaproteobacteria bacterium]